MLGGESNENGEKTRIGLISRKATLHVQHTFFLYFFAVVLHDVQRETSRNFLVTRFLEEMSYVFLFTFFHCRSFLPWWPPPFLSFSPPLQNFMIFLQQKCLLFFFAISFSVLGRGRCDHHFCPLKADTHEGFCSRSMLQGHAPGTKLLRVYQRFHGYTSS